MAKYYFKSSSKEDNQFNPNKLTVDFILSYSKALRVINYNGSQFETLLN